MTEELDPSELAKDAIASSIPADDKLKQVGLLAQKQADLEAKVKNLEDELKSAKADLEVVATKELPEAVLDAGLRKITTDSGIEIKLEHQYFPSVLADDEGTFHQWLLDHEKDGILNVQVVVSLGKGQGNLERARDILQKIRDIVNEPVELKGDIHWATFRAFARELTESKEDIPPELKIHHVDRAKVKIPKAKEN